MQDNSPNASQSLAAALARRLHKDQRYGEKQYFYGHIVNVVAVLDDFWADDEDIIAGYLHDSVEDTPMTVEVINQLFGPQVASIVSAVTGVGENRKERNESIYLKITAYPRAAIVKVADRIANLEACGPKHSEMYRKEREDFDKYVAVHVSEAMQARLNRAYGD